MEARMIKPTSDIVFSPVVKEMQEKFGSRGSYAKMDERGGFRDVITDDLVEFIGARDSFYLATASADGQPYIQHRGGPKGFLCMLDSKTLAFADYSGNKQYITAATLEENNKAYIFLMDYPNRKRVKIWGEAQVVDNDQELLESLHDPQYKAKLERVIKFHIKMIDINCPQHIKPRYTEEEIDSVIENLNEQIKNLKEENKKLKKEIKS
ncbi:MAG: putative pyridoxine 5'-phosphate oxidase superfamily flavin-nucleotide-binding protein [Lysobacterales bacterium]|jgi:predicted pyridoxine 5'-phosphate oxidase superfamily flavin-nucleotide-binding protein